MTFGPSLPEAGYLPSEVTGRCLMSLVTEYLDARGVPYEVIHHDPSRTSLEEARAVHLDADHVLKAVVTLPGAGVLSPSSLLPRRLDMHLVREALADRSAYLATEDQLECEYPSIELGGAPVLGCLLDAETLVDPCARNATQSCSPPALGRSPSRSRCAISSVANTPPSFGSWPSRNRPR